MAEQIEVLNGTARVGDRVAVAVGAGRYGGGMRVGEVLELTEKTVKVRVEQASGGSWGPIPYIKAFPYPKRMVKL